MPTREAASRGAPPEAVRRALHAVESLRPDEGVRDRLRRVRLTATPIVQAALAAALAWLVATSPPIEHDQPFFAPIAALISVGVGMGHSMRRVVEMVVGVALGVLVGDVIVGFIGVGVVQIAAVVALAMAVAVFLGGGSVTVTQAGASAVLVVVLVAPNDSAPINLDRFVDAAVGGAVGLVVTALLLPINPVRAVQRAIDPLLRTLTDLLERSATALAERDRVLAAGVLTDARNTQADIDAVAATLDSSSEVARIAPVRWRAQGRLVGYLDAAEPIDYSARNIRVLARHAISMLRRREPVPHVLPDALRTLAGAVRLLRLDLESGATPAEARASAVAAAEMATEALDQTGGFAGQVVVAQVRTIAFDLLRATGVDRERAHTLMPSIPSSPSEPGGHT